MPKEQVQENITKIVQFLGESSYYRHRKKLIEDLSRINVQTASNSSTDITDEEWTRAILLSQVQYLPYSVGKKIILDCMNHLSSATSHPSIIWSWALQASAILMPVKQTLDLGKLNNLSFTLLLRILGYLSLAEQKILLTRERHTSHTIFKLSQHNATIFKLPQHNALNEFHLLEKFSHLVARERENNQNKAEEILKNYPHLREILISGQRDMRDPNRHFIKPMSTHEYAYWSGDISMHHMMKRYMDEKTKTIVYKQRLHIAEQGVEYELLVNGKIKPDSKVSNSKHFDFQPLLTAYRAYDTKIGRVLSGMRSFDHVFHKTADKLDILWLNIEIKLAEAPVHVAFGTRMYRHSMASYDNLRKRAEIASCGLEACVKLCEAIKNDDLKQTPQQLEPAELRSQLNL